MAPTPVISRAKPGKKKYKPIQELTKGSTDPGCFNAGVYLVRRSKDRILVVQKKLPRTESLARIKNEISILQGLRHENILQYVDAFISPQPRSKASIYTEWCDLGTLDALIETHRKNSRSIPEGFIRHVFMSLADALAYCHCGVTETDLSLVSSSLVLDSDIDATGWLTVIHRDLKASNVFLASGGGRGTYPRVVIGDFGLAIREDDKKYELRHHAGAGVIQAPDPYCSPKVDVWAVGVIMQMLCLLDEGPLGEAPWNKPHLEWTQTPEVFDLRGAGSRYSAALTDAVALCQSWSPSDRPSSVQLAVMLRRVFRANPIGQKPLPKWRLLNRNRWSRTLRQNRR